MRILSLLLVFLAISNAHSKANEAWYTKQYAEIVDGQIEVKMPDGTRCDIVTSEYAIEVDFSRKWAEAIGQSLFYALQTNLKPGIVLIMEKEQDYQHLIRLESVIKHYELDIVVFPIRVWENDPKLSP